MPERARRGHREVVGVIDIGSNSGRVMVFQGEASGHLRLLAGSRAMLRLVTDVDTRGKLTDETMARTMEALRDFLAIAKGASARRIITVATAAMRDAANGALFAERVAGELGIRISIIDADAEARYGFIGAVRGLAVANGLLFDVGGGSMQVTTFARRRTVDAISLPFGALRLSERFLESDPPTSKQLRRLRDYMKDRLAKSRVSRLEPGERLVGTGGTMRNLAKIDRQSRNYPIHWLHGYVLSVDRLGEVVEVLGSTKAKRRDEVPGLSSDRADSIVGGAVAIQTLAEFVRAKDILVSGQGVREGVALRMLNIPMGSLESVKEGSVSSLVSRFDGFDEEGALRRSGVAAVLQRALEPRAPKSVVSAIDIAARILDIGRSLDVVNRHEHVADILLNTELNGFSHYDLALVAAIVRRAGDRHADVVPLALDGDSSSGLLDRSAIILALADEIEARCPGRNRIAVSCTIGKYVTVAVPMLPSWLEKDLDKRFERAFGKPLVVRH